MTVRETIWRTGDHPEWSSAAINKTGWLPIDEFRGAPADAFWIRETFSLSELASAENLVLAFEGAGAFEIYIDGVLLGGSGKVKTAQAAEKPGATNFFLGFPAALASEGEHVLALRASAAGLAAPDDFFLTYRLEKTDAFVGKLTLAILALGAAAAAALILIYFFFSSSMNNVRKGAFFAAISVALGVVFIVLMQVIASAGFVAYTNLHLANAVSAVAAVAIFSALPIFLVLHFRLPRIAPWVLGGLGVFVLSLLAWPGTVFEHDARAFILLGVYCLLICAAAYQSQRIKTAPFFVATAILIGAILIAPQSLYLFLVALSVFLSFSFADHSRQQQLLAKQAEVTAARLEAEMLRKNIQPHFLMNSLTAISEWIETTPIEALRFVDGLAAEFRSLSKISSKQLIPIDEEIELCKVHLDLMGMRQRRKFILNLEGIDMTEMIPPGIFHTLMENAISHNLYREPEILFELSFSRAAAEKCFQLSTPLGERTNHAASSTGTGLQYVKSRLEESYPGRWEFSSKAIDGHWVSRVSIRN